MTAFPLTSDDIKSWIWNTLGGEEISSVEMIKSAVDQHDIDGKVLLLLYKFPHEIQLILPNLRTRLLFMNALDVLMKNVGKNLPASLMCYEIPTRSLLSRLVNMSNAAGIQTRCSVLGNDKHDFPMPHPSSVDDRRSDIPEELSEPTTSATAVMLNTCSAINNSLETSPQEIPSPVPLPVFDHALQQAIANGRLRDRCIRSRIANTCARFYVNLKMYPSQMDYHKICERLVRKYPELMDAQPRIRSQPWGHLKKSLSMAFCNVRRIMKMKDLTSARNIISSIQRRYRGFGRDGQQHSIQPIRRHSFAEDSDSTSNDGSSSISPLKSDVFSSPPPIPTFSPDLKLAIESGKLKDRPWSSQFFRRCAKFYSKLKPYPSRRDYKNISEHLAKTYPDLGHSGHVKHMLSQYIRCHRQSSKLWKLDKQQRMRMLTLELSGNKNFSQVSVKEENSGTTESHPKHSLVSYDGSSVYDFQGGSPPVKEETQCSPYFKRDFGPGRIVPSSPDLLEAKQATQFQGHGSSDPLLCYPVPLPPMDEAMWKGIREGQLQEKNLRNKFIRLCAGFYISLKSYPSKEDYNNVCRTIITQFPDLKDPSPLPGCPPFMLFKKALTACIRNKRRDSVSPTTPIEWTATPQVDPNTSLKNMGTTEKSEKTIDWSYFSNAQILTQGVTSYRDAVTLPCPSGISELTPMPTSISAPEHRGPSSSNQVRAFVQNNVTNEGRSVHHQTAAVFQSGPSEMLVSSETMERGASCPVPLPMFSPTVKILLDAGEPVENAARACFLQNCADFYLSQKLFPNKENVTTICVQLVQAYPQLADPGRLGYANLKNDLIEHFRNYQQQMKVSDEMGKIGKLTENANLEAGHVEYHSNVSISSLLHL